MTTVVTGPPAEPVTTEEVKTHLRVDHSDHDTYIDSLIQAAREWAEEFTRKRFITTTLKYKLDKFPEDSRRQGRIELPEGPVQSITQIDYTDENGNSQTVSSSLYELDDDAVRLKYDQEWPDTRDQEDAVEITYVVGYEDDGSSPPYYAANVPESIKQAIKLHVEFLYDDPGPDYSEKLKKARNSLLWPYRDFRFM